MLISIIVAYGKNREIGKDNQLLWHLSEDLKNFKRITQNHVLIMGRKTYESIGKPLPKRKTIIITRQHDFTADNCLIAQSIEQAIDLAKQCTEFNLDEVFILGGGEIYSQYLPVADKLYLTEVNCSLDADTYFPQVNFDQWELMQQQDYPLITDSYSWSFKIYTRR